MLVSDSNACRRSNSHFGSTISVSPLTAMTTFNVYGFRFSIRSAVSEAVEGLEQDFAFFRSCDLGGGVTLELLAEDPPREGLPLTDALVYTPRNVVYRNGSKRYI